MHSFVRRRALFLTLTLQFLALTLCFSLSRVEANGRRTVVAFREVENGFTVGEKIQKNTFLYNTRTRAHASTRMAEHRGRRKTTTHCVVGGQPRAPSQPVNRFRKYDFQLNVLYCGRPNTLAGEHGEGTEWLGAAVPAH